MDKVKVTLLLRKKGVPLSVAHDATRSVLRREPVSVQLREGADVDEVRRELGKLGVIL